MRLAVTGYVSETSGSVASANALLLRALLSAGWEIHFFSKASFVDPRPAVAGLAGFTFSDVDNTFSDRFRAAASSLPGGRTAAGLLDSRAYHRLLVRSIAAAHRARPFAASLWLGDYTPARVPGLPTVSFAQGPPGTDARSILQRHAEIRRLAGALAARKWRLFARARLSLLRPNFTASDLIIVGSEQSRRTLRELYAVPDNRTAALPYPIDLDLFRPSANSSPPRLRVLWLGRIIPRKRLDLFLAGCDLAIRQGWPLEITIVGSIGFISGYEKLIRSFPHDLTWLPHLPRTEVPALLARHDVLVQPSDEENFGSSVAEAQACGRPVIIGRTNGNADYLSPRDIHLADDRPATLAAALASVAAARPGDPALSRRHAEKHFGLASVSARLRALVASVTS